MNELLNNTYKINNILNLFRQELKSIIKQEEVFMVNINDIALNYKDIMYDHDEDTNYRIRMNLLHKFNHIQKHLAFDGIRSKSH